MADPSTLSVVKDVFAIVQSIVVTAAAAVGLWGINAWRRQLVGKRRTEIAEQALAYLYEAEKVFRWARSPGAFGGEGETREPLAGETPQDARLKNAYFTPIERLNKKSELFAKIDALSHVYRGYFGEDAAQPFEVIRLAYFEVVNAAGFLIGRVPERAHQNEEGRAIGREFEAAIGWGHGGGPDALSEKISEAVKRIETTCRPILAGKEG